MALPSAPWADMLERWNITLPDEGEHTVAVTVRGDDFANAVILATRLPGIVAALRDFPNLAERPSGDLGVLLHRTHELVVLLSSLEEHIIRAWHERPEDRGSYRAIAQYLDISHAAVRDRYQRIIAAAERGLSAVGAEDQDAENS